MPGGRELPNARLRGFFELGEDLWDADGVNDYMSTNLLIASVLIQGVFISKVSTTPGSPADKDVYVFDETHGTNPNDIAIYDVDEWKYITPKEGWMLYNLDEEAFEKFNGTSWAVFAVGGSGVSTITPGEGIAVDDTVPSAPEVSLAPLDEDPSGVYLGANIAVDAFGRVIAAEEGPAASIVEAPTDGNFYARKDGDWAPFTTDEDAVTEAPEDGTFYARKDGDWAAIPDPSAIKYRIGFSIENEQPGADEVLLRHVFTDAVDFADDFAGSVGRHGGGNPATDQVFSILHNGSAVGSVVLSSAGAVTFDTVSGSLSVSAGDELRIEAPAAPHANTVGLAVTLYGVEA